LSSDDWLSKIKQEKQKENNINADVEADKKAWEAHREKHKDEAKRIMESLNSELRKVAEVYTDSSKQDFDKPKVEGNDRYVQLSLPIVRTGLYQGYSISFMLNLTEKGYGLNVSGGSSNFIPPPVTLEAIQKEVMYFLQRRSEEVARMAEQEKRFHKQMG
jgi:hypothetical protein